ncbi:phospholipase D-like domain-containing protein [Leifsonia sp. NCR5]|uniref:phospholipase D-like domain-containing protein n=1 Tax=Leifsonia sp. NCR5 TaxID=1978342 RepID=UPI000A18CDD0|nr:phospholipase D-like domain-containing protein [Leifsonia sp. NCR5]
MPNLNAERIGSVIREHLPEFAVPGALSVRPGYLLADGWITDTPAIVVTIARDASLPTVRDALPAEVDGLPVDARVASAAKERMLTEPAAFARTAGPAPDRGAVPEFADEYELTGAAAAPGASIVPGVDFAAAAKPQLPYAPPPGGALAPVSGTMRVTLSASPDSGWPTLGAFLSGVRETLTVGLYDFTSRHILQTVETVLAGRTVRLVLDHPAKNPTADQTDEQTVAALTTAFGDHLTQAWALSRMDPLAAAWIFPSAYHIKLAVRDSSAVWLSSGNWNNSNQPDIDPVTTPADASAARSGDRDWHVVIENEQLARTFEAFLLNDLAVAAQHQATTPAAGPVPALLAPLATTPPYQRFFAADTAERQLTVTPLLTPDAGSYAPHILDLIRSATTSLLMQFQYIELPKTVADAPAEFLALIHAVIDRQQAGVDVRIIMSQFETAGYLEKLQAEGLDVVNRVKLQNNVHNKGIVVDGRAALVSSQNWSPAGTLTNRDAGVILENAEIAAYFTQLFEHDWAVLASRSVAPD